MRPDESDRLTPKQAAFFFLIWQPFSPVSCFTKDLVDSGWRLVYAIVYRLDSESLVFICNGPNSGNMLAQPLWFLLASTAVARDAPCSLQTYILIRLIQADPQTVLHNSPQLTTAGRCRCNNGGDGRS
ncbi:unnamed protein product [Polarella glacialis]|uniref:Uncharacterized protein n=1 Tax=Polarella glacialis TaxID=89957 RepID=A0A813EWI4_POLGL|nr:unnamed protein product [Polarella glacialis]